MTLISTVVTVALFIVAFRIMKIVTIAASAVATTRETTAIMADRTLGDDAKERAARRASKRLIVLFFNIVLRSTLVLVIPAIALYLFDSLGLVSFGVATAFLLRPDVIAVSAAATIGAAILWR